MGKLLILIMFIFSIQLFSEDLGQSQIFILPDGSHLKNTYTFREIHEPVIKLTELSDGTYKKEWGFINDDQIVFFYSYETEEAGKGDYEYYFRLSDRKFEYDNHVFLFNYIAISVNYISKNMLEGAFHELENSSAASDIAKLFEVPIVFLDRYEIIYIESVREVSKPM